MDLGKKVRLRREYLGMSQEELAIKMGYKSRSSINKIECGRSVSQKIIYRLAEVLETTPAYLLGWENDPEGAAAFEASILTDAELMEMIKEYQALSDEDKKTVIQMIRFLSSK